MRVLFASVLSFALAGCTIRHECIPYVTPTTTSELGIATIDRCGIGHCIRLGGYGQPWLRFRLPTEPGTTTLEELDAQRCSDPYDASCEPVTGTIVVREVHPPEDGQPVGRLDADLTFTGAQPGTARIDYREQLVPTCHDVDWPDIRIPWPGPGQL